MTKENMSNHFQSMSNRMYLFGEKNKRYMQKDMGP